MPYYLVISDNKDATFSPRFYNDEQFLIQNEFRSIKKDSNYISDFSFKVDDFNKLKSHFFMNMKNHLILIILLIMTLDKITKDIKRYLS